MIRTIFITGLVVTAIGAGVILAQGPAQARSGRDRCDGILHQNAQELWFGGERGEGESICVIAPAEMPKVLRVCAAGRYCRVVGSGGDCEGSGECLEMKRIVSVTARKPVHRR